MATERVIKALGERFAFQLANTGATTKVVALLAAVFDTLAISVDAGTHVATVSYNNAANIVSAGYICDAVLDDGTIATNLVATPLNSKLSIRQFREYIKQGGKILVDMSVQANNAAAFNQQIEVVKYSPLGGSKSEYLPLNDFKSVDQTATDKINVNGVELELTYDTLMLMPIAAGHTVTISFRF